MFLEWNTSYEKECTKQEHKLNTQTCFLNFATESSFKGQITEWINKNVLYTTNIGYVVDDIRNCTGKMQEGSICKIPKTTNAPKGEIMGMCFLYHYYYNEYV